MDLGIRPFCNAKFLELLPERAVLGNAGFRKAVRNALIEAFDCSEASASTHYNHSFQKVKKENPELVEGLGRPDDKKGGRKRKAAPAAAPVLLLTYTPPATFKVVRASDENVVVAEGLTEAAANELVDKAAKAKKAKLRVL